MTFCAARSGRIVSKRHGPVFYQANDEHDPTERTIERGPGEATRRDIGNLASRLALCRVNLSSLQNISDLSPSISVVVSMRDTR
jgi:hypothetical protein